MVFHTGCYRVSQRGTLRRLIQIAFNGVLHKCSLSLLIILIATAAYCRTDFRFKVKQVPASGFAKPGDKISFKFTLLEKGKPVNLPFSVKLHIEGKKSEVTKGNGVVTVNAIAPEHGFVYASGSYRDGKKRSAPNFYSVGVNPEKIC